MSQQLAVVTGASTGLGLATSAALARAGHHVIASARDLDKLDRALAPFVEQGLAFERERLDVSSDADVDRLFERIDQRHAGRLGIVINNAAGEFDDEEGGTFDVSSEVMLRAFDVNALGPFRMCQRALPRMNSGGYGRIVNVSTGMAGLTEMNGGYPAYRLSKTALNAVTRVFHAEVRGDVKINSVCPGWVRTRMGGPHATRSVDEGIRGILWAASLPADGPSGGFFRDGKPIPW